MEETTIQDCGLQSDYSTNNFSPTQLSTRQLTFGEKLVGITFNPSNDGYVSEIKTKCAELANLINEIASHQEQSEISVPIYNGAIQRLLDAQMWLVKYVTLKY